MKKTSKLHIMHIVLEWLMIICMINTGYSIWSITKIHEDSLTSSMKSHPVIKADEYVSIEEIGVFDYCAMRFYSNPAPTITENTAAFGTNGILTGNVARITIPVTLNDACFTSGTFTGKMGMNFTISFVDKNGAANSSSILNYCDTVTVSVPDGTSFDATADGQCDKENGVATVAVNLDLDIENGSQEEFYITIDFTIDIGDSKVDEFFANSSVLDNKKIVIQTIVKDSYTS